ncbi:hypothetical protein CSUI_009758 [Cystoisospora suis]|uniref:Transmembrane protein n=1 Tax=Cystoisospora suis TaxID=483139 RepID=A0A2C6KIF5_9APIC|nr:hypothetical protein CSUI_009758 [Cystoisospora suis]
MTMESFLWGRVLCPCSGQTLYLTPFVPREQTHWSSRCRWQIGGLALLFFLAVHLALSAGATTTTPAFSPAGTLETPAPVPAKLETTAEEDESSEEGESSSEEGASLPVAPTQVPGQNTVSPTDPLQASSGVVTEGEGAPGGVGTEDAPLAQKIAPLRASRVANAARRRSGFPSLTNMAQVYAGLTLLAVLALATLASRRAFSEDVRSPTVARRPYLTVTTLTLIATAVAFFLILKLRTHGVQPGSVLTSAGGL